MIKLEVCDGYYICGQRWSVIDRGSGQLLFGGIKTEQEAQWLKTRLEKVYAAGIHKTGLEGVWLVDDNWIKAD